MQYQIVEKRNHLAVHGIFYSKERAEQFLKETVPYYITRGLYTDKTLTAESFEVIERKPKGITQ